MKLNGKVAIVTGASAGMGKDIALLFAKEGANVIAVARRMERLEELAKAASDYSGKIIPFQGDVSKKEDNEKMIEAAVEQFGKLDILVNNAGIMDEMMPVGEVDDELWDRVISVNLTGPFYACRKAVNQMLKQGGGNIINVASIGGLYGGKAGATYTASKHGLIGLTKNIGYMYAPNGIRCNAICPGGVKTEIAITKPSQTGLQRAQLGMATMPRMGEGSEIAAVALFLACDESSFVNGATIVADAGWTAV